VSVRDRIIELLGSIYPLDISIKDIAGKLKVSRGTVSKYIAVLEAEGIVECRIVGRVKLYKLRK
jgi:Mn-dependent DtxR family transcriptional regulator